MRIFCGFFQGPGHQRLRNNELLATFSVVKILNGEFCMNWEGGIAAKRTSVSSDFGELSRAVEPRKKAQRSKPANKGL
jgi:hypothetical protein